MKKTTKGSATPSIVNAVECKWHFLPMNGIITPERNRLAASQLVMLMIIPVDASETQNLMLESYLRIRFVTENITTDGNDNKNQSIEATDDKCLY